MKMINININLDKIDIGKILELRKALDGLDEKDTMNCCELCGIRLTKDEDYNINQTKTGKLVVMCEKCANKPVCVLGVNKNGQRKL